MQLVQFFVPGRGRRVGVVRSEQVVDLTGSAAAPASVVELALSAFRKGTSIWPPRSCANARSGRRSTSTTRSATCGCAAR